MHGNSGREMHSGNILRRLQIFIFIMGGYLNRAYKVWNLVTLNNIPIFYKTFISVYSEMSIKCNFSCSLIIIFRRILEIYDKHECKTTRNNI